MTGDDVVRAFANRVAAPDNALVRVDGEALTVDDWWPAALWLGPATCLVRLDEGPGPGLPAQLAQALAAAGLKSVDADPSAIEAITVQRLGLMGAAWQVWADDDDTARAAIADAAAG
ncbi:MAG: hypothetical protein ACR2K0_10330 [Acidimicrobiales bacterium]